MLPAHPLERSLRHRDHRRAGGPLLHHTVPESDRRRIQLQGLLSQSQRATPYIGQDDAPTKVSKLFTTAAPTGISWADAGFVQPFLNRLNTTLTFGATEYVGRRYSERSTNTGAGGRTSTNVILSTTRGELVIAPASGKIDLAEDLGGDYGITLVIDHGAGVRTIFYGLSDIDIKAGQQVKNRARPLPPAARPPLWKCASAPSPSTPSPSGAASATVEVLLNHSIFPDPI